MSEDNRYRRPAGIPTIEVEKLIPYDDNPYNHKNTIPELEKAIKENGWTAPIIITRENKIVCGHGRRLVAIKLGLTQVPCVVVDLEEKEYLRAMVSDNKIAELTKIDKPKMQKVLDLIGKAEAQQVPGVSDKFIDKIFRRKHNEVITSEEVEANFGDAGTVSVESDSSSSEDALVKRKTFLLTPDQHKIITKKLKGVMKANGLSNEAEAFLKVLEPYSIPSDPILKKGDVKEVQPDE